MSKLLILGGTADARCLANRLADAAKIDATTSLAGRTRTPRLPAGAVRTGGFGGVEGLTAYLTDSRTDLVVDATHPFAATISHNAAEACARTNTPHLMLLRQEWRPESGDRWIEASNAAEAAEKLAEIPGPVFLAIGRQELAPFAALTDRRYLLRMVETPETPLALTGAKILTGRGPFEVETETALLRENEIGVVVSKNSGGVSAYAKIEAARALAIPVIMISRPTLPDGPRVESVEAAEAWVERMSP